MIKLGIAEILTLVFVILKLCGKIAWSWWWVFSPIWIAVVIVIILIFIINSFNNVL